MTKWLLTLALAANTIAFAQDRPFLSRAELKPLAEGKDWTQRLISDGSTIKWNIKNNGSLYAVYKGGGTRNQSATFVEYGTWTINDAGQMCVQWRGSKWPSADQCLSVVRDGEAFKLYMGTNPEQAYADLSIE